MELFDTHFHYYGESSPLEFMAAIRSALAVPPQSELGRVTRLRMTAMGGDLLESRRAREFAGAVDNCYFAVGVHPHMAATYREAGEDFSEFESGTRPVAVGELGLDYFYDGSPRDVQISVFGEFLDLALKWDLPAVVHIRDKADSTAAYDDAEALLAPFAAKGGRFVVHCFTGEAEYARRFIGLGAYLGVTGMITFKRADNVREIARLIPDDRLLIETDSPYLAPVPHRGEDNHPGFLILAADRLAAERGTTLAELAELTSVNAARFYGVEE
ncbi:MAG: TatD family hydrolase [Victivallaceae bacterium]|nr:TatD family hydrolase [Victivallaceae bacterium]